MSPKQGPPRDLRQVRVAASLTTIGLTLALSIAIGVGLGILIDGWLKTGGIAVIVGSLLGIGAGFKQFIQAVMRANWDQAEIEADQREGREEENR